MQFLTYACHFVVVVVVPKKDAPTWGSSLVILDTEKIRAGKRPIFTHSIVVVPPCRLFGQDHGKIKVSKPGSPASHRLGNTSS